MKKIYSFVLAAVAVLSAASCQKELANAPEVENGEKFTVVATAAETKTVLEGNVAYWMPGDKITIFDATGEPVVFTTNITEKAAKAEFTAESFNAPDSLVAVYNPTRAATLTDGKIYPLRAGGDQKPVAGSFDPNAAIAVGGSKAAGSNELVFNNIHSLVKFTVGDVVPSSVKVVNNGGAILVGLLYWNVEAAAIEHSGAGESSVIVSGTYEKGQTYYIAVTPNEAKGGLSVYFDDVLVKNTGADITLLPNTIYNLGTLPAAAEPEEPKEPAKLWTKYPAIDLAGYDAAQHVRLAAYGDKLLVANTTKVYVLNPVTGEVESTVNMPDGVAVQSLATDDAGNVLIAADAAPSSEFIVYTISDFANLTPEVYLTYNTGNYYGNWTGNLRVKGNIKDDAVITAVVTDGAGGACLAWEVVDGVCSTWYWTNAPYTGWNTAGLCFAPAGASFADGFFYIGYGGDYSLRYAAEIAKDSASTTWTTSYVTGSAGNENYNCISTADWKGSKYAAIVAGCHFNWDDPEVLLLDINNPASAELVYTYLAAYDVRDAEWANQYWTGLGFFSDVLLMPTEDALLMAYIDSNAGAMSCVAIY